MSMALTQLVPTMETLTSSWRGSMSTTMRPPVSTFYLLCLDLSLVHSPGPSVVLCALSIAIVLY